MLHTGPLSQILNLFIIKKHWQVNEMFTPHRDELLDGEVVAERSVASVAPGLGVDGHAVLPLAVQQVLRLVAIGAGVITAVFADGAEAPAVVRHHRVSHRTAKDTRVYHHEMINLIKHTHTHTHTRTRVLHGWIITCRCRARPRSPCCSSTRRVRLRPRRTTAPPVCTWRRAREARAEF